MKKTLDRPSVPVFLYKGALQCLAPNIAQPPQYFWSPRLKIAYCLNSKVASTTIRKALLEVEIPDGAYIDPYHRDIRRKFVRRRPPREAKLVFGFVRHPIDRLVSFWVNKFAEVPHDKKFEIGGYLFGRLRRDMTLDELIEAVIEIPDRFADRHFRSQVKNLRMREAAPDIIGRVENIAEDWRKLQEEIPLLPDLGRSNKTKSRKPDLDANTKLQLKARYAEDFATFYPDDPI